MKDRTVIISCAGMGRRLGIGVTKALLMIDDKPLIIRQLEMLKDCDDVRIVVGYQAQKVIDVVTSYRKDVTFVINHDYQNNGTAASVSLALENSRELILTIDGDTIIHPLDMSSILESETEFIGVTDISSDDPVLVEVINSKVNGFSRKNGKFEWTGIAQLNKNHFKKANGHVYESIEPFLPLPFKKIKLKEIDTINDFDLAVKWVKNGYKDDLVIGVLGGMGSFATLDFFRRILEVFPAEKEWERPRVIIDNKCTMPSRVRAILYGEKYDEVLKELIMSIEGLINQGANSIILACNTSHHFLNEIANKRPYLFNYVLDMVQTCVNEIKKAQVDDLYIMASEGTIQTDIYGKLLKKEGIRYIYPDKKNQEKIRSFIESVKIDKLDQTILEEFTHYINHLEQKNVLLACTELPILYSKVNDKIDENKLIIDPLESVLGVLKGMVDLSEEVYK